nr:MAG TPA: hypothetical protein [Caudoviricetes sp.]
MTRCAPPTGSRPPTSPPSSSCAVSPTGSTTPTSPPSKAASTTSPSPCS